MRALLLGCLLLAGCVVVPPRAMGHEFSHVVYLSNGIESHPCRYAQHFRYWQFTR